MLPNAEENFNVGIVLIRKMPDQAGTADADQGYWILLASILFLAVFATALGR